MTTDVRTATWWTVPRDDRPAATVARIDLRSSRTGGTGSDPGATHDMVLASIVQTVRSDDRVCPYGLSRIAIAFGADAGAVSPRTLGERLARAVGQGAGSERRSARPRPAGTTAIPSMMVVTVDRLLAEPPAPATTPATPAALTSLNSVPVAATTLRHRTVVRYSTCRLGGYGTRHDDRLPGPTATGSRGTVLVVDPGAPVGSPPGLAAVAASSLAERMGFTSAATATTSGDPLILDIGGSPVDLAVLVVGGEPTDHTSTWSSSTWSVPSLLAGAYTAAGVGVLAVSSGAGAGALAGCLEQGAIALSDIDGLPADLHALFDDPTARTGSAREEPRRWPPGLEALMQLTASERRVLYYLTRGSAAQDIAADLVVSLATVRSHIRSILRKLGVRSQLAAVAIANNRLDGTVSEVSAPE